MLRIDLPYLFADGDVPDTHGAIRARRNQPLAVAEEGEVEDPAAVSAEFADLLACRDVPKNDGGVVAARGQELAVGRQHERTDGLLLRAQNAYVLVGSKWSGHLKEQKH